MGDWILKYWMQVVFAALAGAFGALFASTKAKAQKDRDHIEAIGRAVQAILRDRIIQSAKHYLEKRTCPIYARENIESLYVEYKNLGGNGTIKDLVEEVFQLPYS